MANIVEQFGPAYNLDSPALRKYRALARHVGSISKMLPQHRRAYAEAVEAAIRAKRPRSETPLPKPNCASGTFHNNAADIERAIREQNRRRQNAAAMRDRSNRTPEQWRAMYAAAMAEKRQAEQRRQAA